MFGEPTNEERAAWASAAVDAHTLASAGRRRRSTRRRIRAARAACAAYVNCTRFHPGDRNMNDREAAAEAITDLFGDLSHLADEHEHPARQLWEHSRRCSNRPRLHGRARQVSATLADLACFARRHGLDPETLWRNGWDHYTEEVI